MRRINLILGSVLAAQIGLGLAVWLTRDAGAMTTPVSLLSDFDAQEVDRVEIIDGSRDADADDRRIELRRKGEDWVVSSHGDYPAKREEVEELLAKLAGLRSRGPVTTSEARHQQLGVSHDSFERQLTIETEDATTTLYLGRGSGFRKTNVRIGDEAATHTVGGFSLWDAAASVSSWVSTKVVDIPEEELVGLRVRNEHGTLELRRYADEAWRVLDGPAVEDSKIEDVLRAARSIRLERPVSARASAEQGFEDGAEVVVLTGNPFEIPSSPRAEDEALDGATEEPSPEAESTSEPQRRERTIKIGTLDGDDAYFLQTDDRPHVVTVAKGAVSALLDLSAEQLGGSGDEP